MKERILEFLKAENKSSAQLAVEIGVQPSGISHILSGRNNPSLDFVIRMLDRYKYLSMEWLLFGRGTMYREIRMPTLFDNLSPEQTLDTGKNSGGLQKELKPEESFPEITASESSPGTSRKAAIKKIVWFYDNNEFEEFSPAGDRILT